MEHLPKAESLREELKYEVDNAMRAALPEDEYEEKIQQLRVLRKKQAEEGLTIAEDKTYFSLRIAIAASRVKVKTLTEYRTVLELLNFPAKAVEDILAHENAHANVAEQLPSQKFLGYMVTLTKEENGRLNVQPTASLSINSSFPEDQKILEEIYVTEAPLHYGNSLSLSDKNKIEELKKKLER